MDEKGDIHLMKNGKGRAPEPALGKNAPVRVIIVAGCADTLVDVLGPYQVFLQASFEGGTPFGDELGHYRVEIASLGPNRLVASRGGIALECSTTLDEIEGELDTLIVAGSSVGSERPLDRRIVEWVRKRAPGVRRVASVCSGAFYLAEAGLLDGRRATTHWRYVRRFAERYPTVIVEPDPIYVRDGKFYTSAGMTAGMDLALALVEEDYGGEVALAVARSMVIYLRRPGGQAQFSAMLKRQAPESSPVHRVQHWIAEHLEEPISVDRLSEVAGMSPRNFSRVFVRDTGTTPWKFVEEIRLEEARRMLQATTETVDRVAELCGFGSTDTLQRQFQDFYGASPSDFRNRFQTALRK